MSAVIAISSGLTLIASFITGCIIMAYTRNFVDIPSFTASSGVQTMIQSSLSHSPIIDILITNQYCPAGYEVSPIGNWPGTVQGYNCQGKLGFEESKGDGTYSVPCDSVDPRAPFNYFYFKKADEIMCIKRARENEDYLRAEECPANHTECAPGFCFKTSECPLTRVTLTSTQNSPNAVSYQNKFLNKFSVAGEPFLNSITTSYYGSPCLDSFKGDVSKASYIFMAKQPTSCEPHGFDESSTVLLSTTENSILSLNNAPSERPDIYTLDQYTNFIRANTKVDLVGRKMVEVHNLKECFDLKFNTLKDANAVSSDIDYITMVGSAIEISFSGFFILACIVCIKCGADVNIIAAGGLLAVFVTGISWLVVSGKLSTSNEFMMAYEEDKKTLIGCVVSENIKSALDGPLYSEVADKLQVFLLVTLILKAVVAIPSIIGLGVVFFRSK